MRPILSLALLLLASNQLHCRSLPKRQAPSELESYLVKYGYISKANLETGAMRSKEEFTNAVENLQRMAGLPPTGDPNDKALLQLQKKPRCGFSDKMVLIDPKAPARYKMSGHKWDGLEVTWRITKYSVDLDVETQREDISMALDLWHKSSSISFKEVGENEEANITISFEPLEHGDGYPFDGQGGELAHANFPGTEAKSGDLHFDEDEYWTSKEYNNGINLFIVAAHELGHSLGIDHSEVANSLMFPWYIAYQPNYKLPRDDVFAIQAIYGPPPSNRATLKPPLYSFTSYPPWPKLPSTPLPRLPQRSDGVNPPDPCYARIDDVALIRGEAHVFIDKWFWKFDKNDMLINRRPFKTISFFNGLPLDEPIKAATDLPLIDLTIFFLGIRFFLLRSNALLDGFPKGGKDIRELGIQTEYVDQIDAAMVWGFNQRVYIFCGDIYWRLSNDTKHMTRDGAYLRVDEGYPMSFDLWQGIPVPIDGAYSNNKRETFFFKGTQYWRFDDASMQAEKGYPKDIAFMLKCRFSNNKKLRALSQVYEGKGSSWVLLLASLLFVSYMWYYPLCPVFSS